MEEEFKDPGVCSREQWTDGWNVKNNAKRETII